MDTMTALIAHRIPAPSLAVVPESLEVRRHAEKVRAQAAFNVALGLA